ncbi:conserved hypothetical protein [Actinomyces sp. oral taxon 180 str. F0310]|nr:conserved hypothetical protein [Actinomyces sp. oral taxon 180 str. F0310]
MTVVSCRIVSQFAGGGRGWKSRARTSSPLRATRERLTHLAPITRLRR